MSDLTFAGIDPDLHSTGVAFITEEGGEPYLVYAGCVKSKGSKQHLAVIDMANALRDFFTESPSMPTFCTGFAVEAQEMYHGKTKDPRSIMLLANAAGCALQEMVSQYPACYSRFPAPGLWKGQVPKHIKQARAFGELRIDYSLKGNVTKGSAYCVPKLALAFDGKIENIKAADWKHVGDAVGLALWCRQEYHHHMSQKRLRANRA